MDQNKSLAGKHILVTGASSGIGEKIALFASDCGANVTMIARNEERLKSVQNRLTTPGAYYVQDLMDTGAIKPLTDRIVEEHGRLDGFVHCAGIVKNVPLKSLKLEMLHNEMIVNLYAFIELAKNITRKKCFNLQGGSIVGISSISGQRGYKGKTAYCASKAALDSAARVMSAELAYKKIRVNTVAPGFIKTQMYEGYVNRYGQEFAEQDIAKQPLGLGKTDDVANTVMFLLSDASRFITGTTVTVDGGRMATD